MRRDECRDRGRKRGLNYLLDEALPQPMSYPIPFDYCYPRIALPQHSIKTVLYLMGLSIGVNFFVSSKIAFALGRELLKAANSDKHGLTLSCVACVSSVVCSSLPAAHAVLPGRDLSSVVQQRTNGRKIGQSEHVSREKYTHLLHVVLSPADMQQFLITAQGVETHASNCFVAKQPRN